jgi:tRNA splicing ligase
MTNDPLMNQCRKEAEERYPKPLSTAEAMRDSWNEHIAKFEREAYAAALYRERSKPKRDGLSDEEIERMAEKWWASEEYNACAGTINALAAFAKKVRHYAPPGTLTVEEIMEVARRVQEAPPDPGMQSKFSMLEPALRQALTAKARG